MSLELLLFEVTLNGPVGPLYPTDFSFSWPINGGITWNTNIGFKSGIDFAYDARWNLLVLCGTMESNFPPLVVGVPSEDEGIGIGEKTSYSGTDYWSFLLSKDGTDFETFIDTYSDVIINTLAGSVGVTVLGSVPHYKVDEYDAKEGKIIEHIARILRDGGCGYKIVAGGLMVIGLNQCIGSGIGQNWIKTAKRTRNISQKTTTIKIVKTAKLQTHFEFPVFYEAPLQGVTKQDVSFSTPLKAAGVIFSDKSIQGYIDEVAFFDISEAQVGPVILTHPSWHPGVTYPIGTSPGPIVKATFWVYPLKDENNSYRTDLDINCLAVFEGVPANQSSFRSDIELVFESNYDTAETPARPAGDYIDGTIMPTKTHADSIIQALYFDKNKGCHTLELTSDDPIPWMEPGEVVSWGAYNARIENILLSRSGVSVSAAIL